MTALAQLFSPERIRAGWDAARRVDDASGAAAPGETALAFEQTGALLAKLPGPGSKAVVALLAELERLTADHPSGKAPPKARELLDRIEDLVDAIELGAGVRP
jgi:hypothetical protein